MNSEALSGAKDVITENSISLCLLNGPLKSFHGQWVLCPDVDVAFGGSNSHAGDDHTFKHSMGITFHDGAVHEGSRISLVSIAHYIFLVALGLLHLLPLLSCREAATSTAPKDGFLHFLDNLVSAHFKESLLQGSISSYCNVFLYAVCIDSSTVLQNHPVLLAVEWNLLLFSVESAL